MTHTLAALITILGIVAGAHNTPCVSGRGLLRTIGR